MDPVNPIKYLAQQIANVEQNENLINNCEELIGNIAKNYIYIKSNTDYGANEELKNSLFNLYKKLNESEDSRSISIKEKIAKIYSAISCLILGGALNKDTINLIQINIRIALLPSDTKDEVNKSLQYLKCLNLSKELYLNSVLKYVNHHHVSLTLISKEFSEEIEYILENAKFLNVGEMLAGFSEEDLLKEFSKYPNITSIDLRKNFEFEDFQILNALDILQSLSLYLPKENLNDFKNFIAEDSSKKISKLNITTFNKQGCYVGHDSDITNEFIRALAGLNLKELVLDGYGLMTESPEFCNLSTLEKLVINEAENINRKNLGYIFNNEGLKELVLSEVGIENDDCALLYQMNNLKSLEFDFCELLEDGFLEGISQMKNLEHLKITCAHLNNEDITELLNLENIKTIELKQIGFAHDCDTNVLLTKYGNKISIEYVSTANNATGYSDELYSDSTDYDAIDYELYSDATDYDAIDYDDELIFDAESMHAHIRDQIFQSDYSL